MNPTLPIPALILNVHKFRTELESNVVHERTSTDYELDFYIGGRRTMDINGQHFSIENGSVIFRRPGDYTRSVGAYNCYTLTFDLSGEKESLCGTYDRNDPANSLQRVSPNPLLDLIPSHFTAKNPSDYVKIYDRLCYNAQGPAARDTGAALINELLFLVLSGVCHKMYKESEGSRESRILTETCRYVQENFHRNITIKELADNVSFSPSYFFKVFKRAANTTPADYIISVRLSNAKQLLRESDLTMAQIADMCGFNDASYFSYYFKKSFGITPGEYRLHKEA